MLILRFFSHVVFCSEITFRTYDVCVPKNKQTKKNNNIKRTKVGLFQANCSLLNLHLDTRWQLKLVTSIPDMHIHLCIFRADTMQG